MIVTFDPASNGSMLDHLELSELRTELTIQLDRILKDNRVGKWVGGKTASGVIKILLQVNDYQSALYHIKAALDGHWISDCMKVQCLPTQAME